MTKFEVKHSLTAGGDGWPTAEELIEILKSIPGKAKPDIRRHDSQREGTSWSMEAQWDEATQREWQASGPPPVVYPPGVRSVRGQSSKGGWDK